MNSLLIRRDAGAMFIIVLGGLLFVCLAVVSLIKGNGYSFVCMSALGFSFGAIGLYALFDNRPRISISDSGIWIRSIGGEEISWSHIDSADLKWLPRSGDFITISLNTGATHTFFAEGMQISSDELLRLINERIEANDSGGAE